MDTFLNTKLRDVDVESSIQNANNLSLTDDRSVALRKVVNEDTQEEVSRLLLSQAGGVLLAVKQSTSAHY